MSDDKKAESPKKEEKDQTAQEYLQDHAVDESLKTLVADLVASRPANPYTTLAEALLKKAEERGEKKAEKPKKELEGDQKLVNESWAKVKDAVPLADVAKMFYGELFELAPSLKDTVFKDVKMELQGEKLMGTLDYACGFEEGLVPALLELGERHAGYGAVEAHYPVVGQALLTVLKGGLGDAFTPEVEKAWTNVYGVIQTTMLKGQESDKGKAAAAEWAKKQEAGKADEKKEEKADEKKEEKADEKKEEKKE